MSSNRISPPSNVRLTIAIAAAGLALVLAGCAKSSSAPEAVSVDEQVGLDQSGIIQRQVQVERLVRECMKAQGFDYRPVDPRAQRAALVGTADLSENDFAKQYGYGITTLYEQYQRQLAEQATQSGLSDADRLAYGRALYGERTDATLFEALDAGDFSRLGGCTKQATDEAFGGAEVLQSLQSKLDELDQGIATDPRMVAAVREWSTCMRAAGYEGLAESADIDRTLTQKLEDIVGPLQRGTGLGFKAQTYDRAALADLQSEEVAIVAADIACEDKHVAKVEKAVAAEHEAAFRDQNASLLNKVPAP